MNCQGIVNLQQDRDGSIWMSVSAPDGKQGTINLGYLGSPMAAMALRGWAEEQLRLAATAPTYEQLRDDLAAAIAAVRNLDDARSLDDAVYDVRENEGEGWDGPNVTQYSDALTVIRGLLEKYK